MTEVSKGQVVARILCPFHKEVTPSLVIYSNGTFKCYGCTKWGKLDTREVNKLIGLRVLPARQPIDLSQQKKRILELPQQALRGFNFHADNEGFYILYPESDYFVKRLFTETKDKYRSPFGHKKELYKAQISEGSNVVFVIEGQLNAKAFAMITHHNVLSPGPCTDLNRFEFVKHYLQFNNIAIIIDNDSAGLGAGALLKNSLLRMGKRVVLHSVDKTQDYSWVYEKKGPQSLKDEEKRILEMFRGLH